MLNLKALTVAVIIGVLAPILPMNLLSESPVIAQTPDEQKAEQLRIEGFKQLSIYQYQAAIESLQAALKIYQETGNFSGQAWSLYGLGWAYDDTGQLQKAIESYQASLFLAKEIEDHRLEAFNFNLIGYVYLQLGQIEKAIELNQEALTLARRNNFYWEEALFLADIGMAYFRLEKYVEAMRFSQQALAIAQKHDFKQIEAYALSDLGNIFRVLGSTTQALELYKKSIIVSKKIRNRYWEVNALIGLGCTYQALGSDQEALASYQQAFFIAKEIDYLSGEGQALSLIGDWFTQQKQSRLAVTFYKQAVQVYESIRVNIQELPIEQQRSYTNNVAHTYRNLADLLLKENRVLEAQRVLDLLKVQELEDYLKNVRGNANTAGGIEFYQPEAEILARYNELQKNAIEVGEELTQLQQKQNLTPSEEQRLSQLYNLQEEINKDFNNFARSPEVRELIEKLSFDAREQTLSLGALDGLRDKLGDLDAVLFYPLILEDRLELVITTPNSPPLRRTVEVSREELYRTIVRFRLALQDPTIDAVAPAQKLYKWLFEPLEDDLKAANAEVIIYAPDGVLRYIPLMALHDGKRWLAERFRVNNITAASLEEIDTQPQPEPKILAGAFASESLIRSAKIGQRDVQFAGLPFAGIEVAALQNTLTNTTAYVDEAFTLEAMKPKMNGYNILHFATHAAFVPGDPSESFIVFGEGENPTLRDVENWSLSNVDLVVLSACETGLGGFDNNGEQILGLGYQFQNQGARAVLASLWKVSDGGTQVLMNVFYNALQQGYSKTEALQIAQQSLITKNTSTVFSQKSPDGTMVFVSSEIELPANIRNHLDHPYYWASFILIGNGL
ncbi:CHAT domain-containing protein [Lyngbya sp. PCC 8106]|uniref:CHAT domain-containing protein n=1 Tax=Lyngbya sp. (strain PCC 8106) TaxID=313612 RepID=UPI00030D2D5F|nr:CHAT domain-containing protein [Lyngbya sp. PCC 8106]